MYQASFRNDNVRVYILNTNNSIAVLVGVTDRGGIFLCIVHYIRSIVLNTIINHRKLHIGFACKFLVRVSFGISNFVTLMLLDKVLNNILCYGETLMASLVVIENPFTCLGIEDRLYDLLRRSYAIVVIHLEVDEELPIAGITLELRELRNSSVLTALGKINLCVLVSRLGKVPILGRIEIADFSVLVNRLLVLKIGIIRIPGQTECIIQGLLPRRLVERDDVVDARIGHCFDDMSIGLTNENRTNVLGVFLSEFEGLLVVNTFHVIKYKVPIGIKAVTFGNKREVDLDSRITEHFCKCRYFGICL